MNKKASPSAEIKPEALLCSVSTLSSNKSLAASLRTGASFEFSGITRTDGFANT